MTKAIVPNGLKKPIRNRAQTNKMILYVSVSLESMRLSIDAIMKMETTKTPKTGFFIGNIIMIENPTSDPKKEALSKKPEYSNWYPKMIQTVQTHWREGPWFSQQVQWPYKNYWRQKKLKGRYAFFLRMLVAPPWICNR